MTPHQHTHAEAIAEITSSAVKRKYADGQKEHGGNLWEKPMRREIEFELLDLISYWQTLDTQLEVIRKMLISHRDVADMPPEQLDDAIRLLTLKPWKT